MPRNTMRSPGLAAMIVIASAMGAMAQSAGGGAGGSASGSATGLGGGQSGAESGRSDPLGKSADGSTSKGVAGTGMGSTTPAMRDDTSAISGNGLSVQKPDPGKAGQSGSGSNATKP